MGCPVDTRLAPHVGLCRPIRPPRNLILHTRSGRSVDPKAGIVYGASGTPIGHLCADGYVRMGQHSSGHQYAHRLIYEAVHGSIPARHYVDHLNGKRADNRIANLEAVTPAENVARALERGSVAIGEAASYSKLKAAQVREIRQAGNSVSTTTWARLLGVDKATVRAARDGVTWRHVPLRGPLPDKPRWKRRRPTAKR